MMKQRGTAWLLVIVFLAGGLSTASATLVNPDFSNGTTGWVSADDVFVTDEAAALGDRAGDRSRLFQVTALQPGQYVISFDFRGLLAGATVVGRFRDAFFATLYLTDQPGAFDPDNPGNLTEAITLFDLDAAGLVGNQGEVSPSARGEDWQHFRLAFAQPRANAVPVFELYNYNGLNGDRYVLLDDVRLDMIPEPATWLLVACGLAGWAWLGRGLMRKRGLPRMRG